MKESHFQRDRRDPDVIRVKSGGGLLTVFGIPFLAVGVLALLTSAGVLPVRGDGGEFPVMAAGFFGAVFVGVGTVLIFGRSGLVIDRGQGRLVRWQGLLVPFKRTVDPLASFASVRLEHHREENATSYGVLLKGDGPTRTVRIVSPPDYAAARGAAEELARFLGKPMEDVSSGRAVIREPGRLDESFRDGFARRGKRVSFPPQPLAMRTRIEQRVDGVVLSIPRAAARPLHFIPLVGAVLFGWIVVRVVLDSLPALPAPPVVRWAVAGFASLFILAPILAAVRAVARFRGPSFVITAAADGLRVEERSGGRVAVTDIPGEELEELEYVDRRAAFSGVEVPGMKRLQGLGNTGTPRIPDGRPIPRILLALAKLLPAEGITARSDRAIVTFGKGLSAEELVYLHAVLTKALTD